MKKKTVAILVVLIMILQTCVFAETLNPKIFSSLNREICLDVPLGRMTNGVFTAPVRRICEIFDASCDWYEDDQKVIINSRDNVTRVFFYIGKDTFRVLTFTSVISGNVVDIPIDAPAEIVNDRTMVPFDQLCNALGGECDWAEDGSSVTVSVPKPPEKEQMTQMYISSDTKDVSEGDEIIINLYAKNLKLDNLHSFVGYTAGIIYDKTKFEYISGAMTDKNGLPIEAVVQDNKNFTNDSVKLICIGSAKIEYDEETVCVGQIVFRALSDEGGEVKLSNRIYTIGGDSLFLILNNQTGEANTISKARELDIETNALKFE